MIEIQAKLLESSQVSQKAYETIRLPDPEINEATKEKRNWLQGIVVNCTQFNLVVRPEAYFDSGRYEIPPSDVPPWSKGHFTVTNQVPSLGTGASGGNGYDLQLSDGVVVNLSLGWTSPFLGSVKACALETSSCEDAYNGATNSGNTMVTNENYQGSDGQDGPSRVQFEVVAQPGHQAVFTITQAVL